MGQQLYNQKFQNQPLIQIDEFNDSVKINWKVVGGYEDHYEIASDTTIGGVILNTDGEDGISCYRYDVSFLDDMVALF